MLDSGAAVTVWLLKDAEHIALGLEDEDDDQGAEPLIGKWTNDVPLLTTDRLVDRLPGWTLLDGAGRESDFYPRHLARVTVFS